MYAWGPCVLAMLYFSVASDSISGSANFELWSDTVTGMGIRAHSHMSTDYREIGITTLTICVLLWGSTEIGSFWIHIVLAT